MTGPAYSRPKKDEEAYRSFKVGLVFSVGLMSCVCVCVWHFYVWCCIRLCAFYWRASMLSASVFCFSSP